MLELFLPFLKPQNEFQENAKYLAGLYGTAKTSESIVDRLFPSKREELEEKILQRQLDEMGENPSASDFNESMLVALSKASPNVQAAFRELTAKKSKLPTFTRVDPGNVSYAFLERQGLRDTTKASKSTVSQLIKLAAR